MNDTYNANMYLIKSDLNIIENQIETLTEEIQENIFDNTTSPLRNIQVGDDLNGKTLYLDVPSDFYDTYDGIKFIDIVTTNKNNKLHLMYTRLDNVGEDVRLITKIQIYYYKKRSSVYSTYRLYSHTNNTTAETLMLETNKKRFKLPIDFGVVTAIDTNNDGYQYIKIYNDERIIPNYVKHTWVDDEFPSMQKLDNIEQGIKNIGEYYYKPQGWLNPREWLKTSDINNDNKGMNTQNISYSDLNQWSTDLNLIDFDNLDKMTIWNSNISQLNWNETSDIDWEEL